MVIRSSLVLFAAMALPGKALPSTAEVMKGLGATAVLSVPLMVYGIAEENTVATVFGAGLAPMLGYLYSDPDHLHYPAVKTAIIAGAGLLVALPYWIRTSPGTDDPDKGNEARDVMVWTGYALAGSVLHDLVRIGTESRRRKENWDKYRLRMGLTPRSAFLSLDF